MPPWLVMPSRRLRSAGLRAVRRSPLFPRTVVNRDGDDGELAGMRLPETVLVYFPGALDAMYQIVPWLDAFEALGRVHPVVIVCQDSRVAARLRARAALRVLTIARYGRLDDLLARSDVKLALYPSHTPRNFECLRFTSLLHAYIGHGDSDKRVSASNQVKAYDYVLVPGVAAVERLETLVMNFDARRRCIVVGQPRRDVVPPQEPTGDRRPRVLYAPTWEGAQPSVAYGSVRSHGVRLVQSLLDSGAYDVDYRPHPLTGVTSAEDAHADHEIRALVRRAGHTDREGRHRVVEPDREPIEDSFARADALICDVSAVAISWLPTGRPLLVTVPAEDRATAADEGLLAHAARLAAGDTDRTAELVSHELEADSLAPSRAALLARYLGDDGEGDAVRRFVAACSRLAEERDRQLLDPLTGGTEVQEPAPARGRLTSLADRRQRARAS